MIIAIYHENVFDGKVQGQLLSHDWFLIDGGHTNLASKEFAHLVGTPFTCQGYWVGFCTTDVLQLHSLISNSEQVLWLV